MSRESVPRQLLHLVFGGELTDLDAVTFRDLDKLDIVGIFPNDATTRAAWRAKAQATVDVHLHWLLAPDAVGASPPH